jgi:hypothetical protein
MASLDADKQSSKNVSIRIDDDTHAPLQASFETSTCQDEPAKPVDSEQTINQLVSIAVDDDILNGSKNEKKLVSAEKQKETDLNLLLAAWKAKSPSVSISALSKLLEMLHQHKPALDYSKLATSGRQIIQVRNE